MFIRAQMASPDMKLKLAIAETQRHYKRAVSSAAGTAFLPFGMTGARQGSKDQISRTIIDCFGIRDLKISVLLKIMQETLRDGVYDGLKVTFGEIMSFSGVVFMVGGVTAPVALVTSAATAAVSVPATAQKYLYTACDITLILAKSFHVASIEGRMQPNVEDVETAAAIFKHHVERAHSQLRRLVPQGKPFMAFKINIIQTQYAEILGHCWRELVRDSRDGAAHEPSRSPAIASSTDVHDPRAPASHQPSDAATSILEARLLDVKLDRSESKSSRSSRTSTSSNQWSSMFSKRTSRSST